MSPELQGGGDDATQMETPSSTPLRSAVDIASVGEGQVEQRLNQQVQEVPTSYQTQKETIGLVQTAPIPETVQEQTPVVQQEGNTFQVDISQEKVESPPQDIEGLTPQEAEVVGKAGEVLGEWGKRAKDEIIKIADRGGVFRVFEGVGKMVEGMRAKRVYNLAVKEIRNRISMTSSVIQTLEEEGDWFKGGEVRDANNRIDRLTKAQGYLGDIGAKGLERRSVNFFTDPKAGVDYYDTPYNNGTVVEGRTEAYMTVRGVQYRGDGIEDLLIKFSGVIEHTLEGHAKDMVRLNQAKSDVGELRAEVTG